MIRWRFLLTRLVIVVAAVALLCWGLGPVAKYVTIHGIGNITGAKVEIADARVGLFPPRVHYSDVRIADPRNNKAMSDAFRAGTIDLVIDGEALLHRRWVATEGSITGLQIGSPRETAGHSGQQPDQEPASASDETSLISRLVRAAGDELGSQANDLVEDLETTRRSRQIKADWKVQYKSLVDRARNLEQRIRVVRDEVRGIENPLRDMPALERSLSQARQVRGELMSVREEIDSLPQRLQADLAELDQAKQIDLEKIDQFVPGDFANADGFGIDMLSEAVRLQIQQVRGYLEGGRTLAQYTVVQPEANRQRGVSHDLAGLGGPQLMIRHSKIDGLMRASGKKYSLTGVVENLTPTPQFLAEPTRVRLRLEGPETVRVEYIRDRRQTADVDSLTMHWPESSARPIRLGNEPEVGIAIDGGQRELWVQIKRDHGQLEGRLVSKQTGLKMSLIVDSAYDQTAAVRLLEESLAAVDRVEIDAKFSGTWSDLNLHLSTNLTPIFERAVQSAIDGQINASRERQVAKVNQVHIEQTLELRQWLVSQQSEARSLLASADKSLEEMSQKVLDEVGDADAYLGKLRSAIRGRLK